MRFEKCYKCGKHKLVSFNRKLDTDKRLSQEDLEGYQMTYGKNRGLFRCKNCKEDSKFKNSDLSSLGGWTSTKELIKHYDKKEID